MKSFTTTDSNRAGTHTWLTPKYFFDELGKFDLDPCAAPMPRPFDTACTMWSEAEKDGLKEKWFGRVWLNPPYGKYGSEWLRKLEEHGNGIALIFARTDTRWLQPILQRNSLFFLQGRVSFLLPNGDISKNSAGCPSLLIPFGRKNIASILGSNLKGTFKI